MLAFLLFPLILSFFLSFSLFLLSCDFKIRNVSCYASPSTLNSLPLSVKRCSSAGANPGFANGKGGQKKMSRGQRDAQSTLRSGPLGFRVLDALLCYINFIWKHSDTNQKKKHSTCRSNFRGGPVVPLSGSATALLFINLHSKNCGVKLHHRC